MLVNVHVLFACLANEHSMAYTELDKERASIVEKYRLVSSVN